MFLLLYTYVSVSQVHQNVFINPPPPPPPKIFGEFLLLFSYQQWLHLYTFLLIFSWICTFLLLHSQRCLFLATTFPVLFCFFLSLTTQYFHFSYVFIIFVIFSISHRRPWARDFAFFTLLDQLPTSNLIYLTSYLLQMFRKVLPKQTVPSSAPVSLSFIDCQKSVSNFVSLELQLRLRNIFLSQDVIATSNHCVLRKILNLDHFTLSSLLQELHLP